MLILAIIAIFSWPAIAQSGGSSCNASLAAKHAEAARASLSSRNFTAAETAFRDALAACPSQHVLRLELAHSLALQRKFAEARDALEPALAAQPRSENALVMLANIQLMAQQFEQCLKTADSVLAINPRNAAARSIKANAYYLTGQDAEAEKLFLSLVETDAKNEDALYSLGRVYYQQKRFDDAVLMFRRVTFLNPASYKAWDNLGVCYEAMGEDKQAVTHYMKAIDLVHKDHPDYDWPYANLANLLIRLGDYEKGFTLSAEAAQRNPGSARNFYLAGKALAKLERHETAVKWLKRSAELDSLYAEPHYLLGQLYRKLGRAEEADAEFRLFQEISQKVQRDRR